MRQTLFFAVIFAGVVPVACANPVNSDGPPLAVVEPVDVGALQVSLSKASDGRLVVLIRNPNVSPLWTCDSRISSPYEVVAYDRDNKVMNPRPILPASRCKPTPIVGELSASFSLLEMRLGEVSPAKVCYTGRWSKREPQPTFDSVGLDGKPLEYMSVTECMAWSNG